MFVVVYDKQLGCRWYNTETGQIGGQWGPSGYVNLPPFLIAHAHISGNGKYVKIYEFGFGIRFWDVATLTVNACPLHTSLNCDGYGVLGVAPTLMRRGQ
jgi:hypothetical protein